MLNYLVEYLIICVFEKEVQIEKELGNELSEPLKFRPLRSKYFIYGLKPLVINAQCFSSRVLDSVEFSTFAGEDLKPSSATSSKVKAKPIEDQKGKGGFG